MNACCEDLGNRAEGPGPRGGEVPEGAIVTHCTVCECRHFEMEADPVEVGVEVASL